jgi:hypothetical protein
VVFWFFWVFCAGSKLARAVKFGLSWLILAKLTVIVLISDLFWLVGVLSPNPVAFGEILDSNGIFLVLFMA